MLSWPKIFYLLKKLVFRYALLFSFCFCLSLLDAETFILTEKNLIKEIESSPEIDRIELEYLNSAISYRDKLDDFQLSLDADLREERTNEEPVNAASFIRGSSKTNSIGINQPLPYGISVGAGYSINKFNTSGIGSASQARFTGNISVDLFRDFLGRTTFSELKDVELGFEGAELSRKINRKVFQLRLRKLYWDYLAAYESMLISEGMLKSDEKELKLAKEKFKIDAADEGDVARLASQVAERQAQKLNFEGTMKRLEADFKSLLPTIKGMKIKIGDFKKKDKIEEFYACLALIEKQKETPLYYSFFDELVEFKRKQLKYRQKAFDAYSDIDLKLNAEAGLIGTDDSANDAFDDLNSDKDTFAAIGVSVSVPLDSKRRNTEEVQLKAAKRQFQAESKELLAELKAFHETIVDAISLIKGVIENRVSNSSKLMLALEDSRLKYRQARITSQQLLQEQDRYFSNELQVISTQRDLIQLMLDYFAFFTEMPCKLNQV